MKPEVLWKVQDLWTGLDLPLLALGTAYEGFYMRNSKHHKFFQHHEYNLTFCSFRQYGTVSPAIVTKRPKMQRGYTSNPRPPSSLSSSAGSGHESSVTEFKEAQEISVFS